MNLFGKRAVSAAVSGALVLGGLAGCTGPTTKADPTSASEVLARYMETPSHDNYHTDVNMDMSISMAGMSIPITATYALDIAAGNSHGTISMDAMGQNIKYEMYTVKEGENYTQYMTDPTASTPTWTKTSVTNMPINEQLISDKIFSDATFEKTDNGYNVTVPGSKVTDALAESGADFTELLSSLGAQGIDEALAKSTMVYEFDKDCLLQGASMNFSYDITSGEGASAVSGTLTMDIKMSLSNYGKVDASTVSVPDDVKSNAKDNGNLNALTTVTGEVDTAA